MRVSRISSRRSRRASARRIKRERRDALDGDVTIEWVTGASIRSEHWDAFFKFYMHTGSRKWGRPYLTRAFFDRIGATLAERVLLVMARRAGRYIAGAGQFYRRRCALRPQLGQRSKTGRSFISRSATIRAIRVRSLPVDCGGIEAGFRESTSWRAAIASVLTYSAHEFADSRLARAIADYLRHERVAVERTIAYYEGHAPFRRDEDDGRAERLGESFDADLAIATTSLPRCPAATRRV